MASIIAPLQTVLGALPSSTDIAQQVLLSGGASVVLAGLASSAGQNAIDPLHLIFKQAATPAASVAPAQNIPTITGAAFAALPVASQQSLLAAGVHIV